MRYRTLFLTLFCMLFFTGSLAAAQVPAMGLEIVPDQATVQPGEAVTVQLRLSLPEGFKTYALPEESAPHLENIQLENFTAATLQRPEGTPDPELTKALGEPYSLYQGKFVLTLRLVVAEKPSGPARFKGTLRYHLCDKQNCYPPATQPIDFQLPLATGEAVPLQSTPPVPAKLTPVPTPAPEGWAKNLAEGSLIWRLLLGLAIGLLTALTPCVYPLLPIVAGSLVGGNLNTPKKVLAASGLAYAFGMALVFGLFGAAFGLLGREAALFLQERWISWLVGGIFLVVAGSLFDWYDLTLPAWLRGRLVPATQKQPGLLPAFLLGAASALVASPCVSGPALALISFVLAAGSPTEGFLVLFAFGLGIGVPLVGIALLGSLLTKLPKAGSWMQRVKQAMGLLALGVALHYLFGNFSFAEKVLPLLYAGLLILAPFVLGLFKRPGKMAKGAGAILLLAGLFLTVPVLTGEKTSTAWRPIDQVTLRTLRDTSGKIFLVKFERYQCPYCELLEKKLKTPALLEAAKVFETASLNVQEHPEIFDDPAYQSNDAIETPSLWIYDGRGKLLERQGYGTLDTEEKIRGLFERLQR